MALFINGLDQDTFTMNGVSIDNLYVDNVLVFSSGPKPPIYLMTEPLVDDGLRPEAPVYNRTEALVVAP